MAPPRKITPLGPGLLTFGEPGSPLDMSMQTTSVKITWSVNAEEAQMVLSGDSIPGDRRYAAKLDVTVLQDIAADGVIDYTWKHKGSEIKFTFIPDKKGKALVTGKVLIDPIDLGGKVASRNESDFTWEIIGEPVFDPNSNKVSTLVGG